MSKQNADLLKDYIEEVITHKVDCGICGKEWEDEIDASSSINFDYREQTASALMKEGWREINSEEYGALMIVCPRCVEEQIPTAKGKFTRR